MQDQLFTTNGVNATTLDQMYARVIGMKQGADPAQDFTFRWLCDGIVYGSRTQRMTRKAEYALVNMADEELRELIHDAMAANRTMGDIARFINERFNY